MLKYLRWRALGLLLPIVAMAAEADNADTQQATVARPIIDTTGLKPDCFYASQVSNWETLSRGYLLIYAPRKSRAYLLQVAPPSADLFSVQVLAFDGRDRICGRAGDALLAGRGVGRRYSVMNVWRVPEEDVDRVIEGKRQREAKDIQPAAESPGASIETDITPDND